MLHEVGKTVLAGLFVLGAGMDADVDVNDGSPVVGVEEEVEAVRESGAIDGEVGGLGGGEDAEEEGKQQSARHRGQFIASQEGISDSLAVISGSRTQAHRKLTS
jgi:hypothetical protein